MTDMGYNIDNENENKEWQSQDGNNTGVLVEQIKTDELVYVTKPGCNHIKVKRQPANDFDGNVIEVTCQDCPVGWHEVDRG